MVPLGLHTLGLCLWLVPLGNLFLATSSSPLALSHLCPHQILLIRKWNQHKKYLIRYLDNSGNEMDQLECLQFHITEFLASVRVVMISPTRSPESGSSRVD